MKKIVFAVMLLVCFLNLNNAQINFGIKGGFNFANFNYKDTKLRIENSTGWQAGILLQVQDPVMGLGIQPELLYTVVNGDIEQATNSIHYFRVPINLYKSFNLMKLRPYIEAGPYFSYALNFVGDVFESRIEKFDWGIGLGAGIGINKLLFGARYSWGLQDVSGMKDFEMKNNTFSLSLAILF